MAECGTSPDIPVESFSKVVEAIYDCALDPDHWRGTVRQIADLCRSQCCALGIMERQTGRAELNFQVGYDEYWHRLQEEKYGTMNPYFGPLQLLPVGTVVKGAKLVDEHEFLESRFYKEFLNPQGFHDVISFNVLKTKQHIGFFSCIRRESQGRYGDADVYQLTLLSPHICRAVAISDALDLKSVGSEVLEATLNALTAGVYLCDRIGRVVYMNRAAARQVEIGSTLHIENDLLAPVDRTASIAMSKAIAEAIADEAELPSSGKTLALPAGESTGLFATILPLNRGKRHIVCRALDATVAIFVQDPLVVPPCPGEAFAKLYGLTGGELRVLLAVAQGLGVKEAAKVLGISEPTAKTHLQHIYGKTSTSKQTELIHLFMCSAPPAKMA